MTKQKSLIRPPAVPLVVNDPYMSVWSFTDTLSEDWTRHWTGKVQSMVGLIRIDDQAYGFMGPLKQLKNPSITLMDQESVTVLPTRTIYQFTKAGIRLSLTFLTPLLPADLDMMSRPITYLDFQVSSTDGKSHEVDIYFDIGADWAVNIPQQSVVWGRHQFGDVNTLWMGSVEQFVLGKSGDDLRIDWGYLYTAAFPDQHASSNFGHGTNLRKQFLAEGKLSQIDSGEMPQAAGQWESTINAAWAFEIGQVSDEVLSQQLVIAYDDQFSVEHMHRKLRPYWRRGGTTIAELIQTALADYDSIKKRCESFDEHIMADLRHVGGEDYAHLAALSFRQCIAAHKLVVDMDGTPLLFSKENFSNGCIGTVDVTYPSSPFFLLFNPCLLQAQLRPILDYAKSSRWRFPFAPHDLGIYPHANGQVYGGGEESDVNQMPVEECGNMLLMVAAFCIAQKDISFARAYWDLLTTWVDYLVEKGLDPENQLCTDDFAGHLAHNVNLSLKALLAIAAFAKMCEMDGQQSKASTYRSQAEQMAQEWLKLADAGDHYRLSFDNPDSWSQKYNLVWDSLLELNLFPAKVAHKEVEFYKTKLNRYGLPLDNRNDYSKLDWSVWSASLCPQKEDFEAFIEPIALWLSETESRVPLTDWYYTKSGKQVNMQARSVVGGVFIRVLGQTEVWDKWLAKLESHDSRD